MGLTNDPHAGTRTLTYGASLKDARVAMIMLHGRGATPEDILGLAPAIDRGDVAYLAPAAMHMTWYPNTFLVPQQANQPWLNSALQRISGLLGQVETAGIPMERVFLLGFSQGACLTLEYTARHTWRYGGVAGLSGGLIGTEDDLVGYHGLLDGTRVFLGCSDVDPHIPVERVDRTAGILQTLGANPTVRIYPGMGHLVNADELDAVQRMLTRLLEEGS